MPKGATVYDVRTEGGGGWVKNTPNLRTKCNKIPKIMRTSYMEATKGGRGMNEEGDHLDNRSFHADQLSRGRAFMNIGRGGSPFNPGCFRGFSCFIFILKGFQEELQLCFKE